MRQYICERDTPVVKIILVTLWRGASTRRLRHGGIGVSRLSMPKNKAFMAIFQ